MSMNVWIFKTFLTILSIWYSYWESSSQFLDKIFATKLFILWLNYKVCKALADTEIDTSSIKSYKPFLIYIDCNKIDGLNACIEI